MVYELCRGAEAPCPARSPVVTIHEKMKEEIIKNGIWASAPLNPINQSIITDIDEYQGSNKLCLSITQLADRSSYQQSMLVNKWCTLLPELDQIEYLWLPSRVNQKMFDAICQMPSLKTLWIKWSGVKRIDKISNLQELVHLSIGSSSQVENIEPLTSLSNLQTLGLEQLNKISNFGPIGKLTQLLGLNIDGGMWTAQKIENLGFIESIYGLRYFSMINSRLKSKSFQPLFSLKYLKSFKSSWNYPESEFAKLKNHPSLKYGNVETSLKEIKDKYGW